MLLTELSDEDDDSDLIPRLSSRDPAPQTGALGGEEGRKDEWEAERAAQEERMRREAAEEMQREMEGVQHDRSVESIEKPHDTSHDVINKQVSSSRTCSNSILTNHHELSKIFLQEETGVTSFLDEIRDSVKEERSAKKPPVVV